MPASRNEPGEELAVDPRTLPHNGLSHQLLTPPDGSQLLQNRDTAKVRSGLKRSGNVRGEGAKKKKNRVRVIQEEESDTFDIL